MPTGERCFQVDIAQQSTVCLTARETRQGWVILARTSIEACSHTCNSSEGTPDAARCLFEVSFNNCLFWPRSRSTCNEQELRFLFLEGAGGGLLGRGQVQTRHSLGLERCYLQVGLIRNGSGNDHRVVRVDNASNAGLTWERTRAEWRIVRMVDGELGWGPEAWGWG
jgi:hypothetical protein